MSSLIAKALAVPAAVLAVGAWLRWAAAPVVLAYRIGRQMGRVRRGH